MSDSKSQPESLVEEGLQLYGQGKLEQALIKWKAALALVPEHHRAREYLKYVEDNRAALEESFTNAGSLEEAESASSGGAEEAEVYPEMVSSAELGLVADQPDVSDAVTAKVRLTPRNHADPEDRTPIIDLNDLKATVARTKRRLTAEIDPLQVKSEEQIPEEPPPLPEEDDLELDEAWTAPEALVDDRKPTETPANMSMAVNRPQGRNRRATPLTLIGGGGQDSQEEFEPMEATPVSMLPDPSIQLTRQPAFDSLEPAFDSLEPAFDSLEPATGIGDEEEMLGRDRATPTSMRKVPLPTADPELSYSQLQDRAPERAGSGTPAKGTGTLPMMERPAPSDEVQPPPMSAPSSARRASGTPPRGSGTMPLGVREEEPEKVLNALPPDGKENDSARLDSMLAGASQLYEQGTYEGSLWLCERVLAIDADHAEAQQILNKNREVLKQQYVELLGDNQQVPVVLIPQHEIVWHKLDHRAGFLLSRIDGQLSFEELLDVSGMSDFEAYRILAQLLNQGVIGPQR